MPPKVLFCTVKLLTVAVSPASTFNWETTVSLKLVVVIVLAPSVEVPRTERRKPLAPTPLVLLFENVQPETLMAVTLTLLASILTWLCAEPVTAVFVNVSVPVGLFSSMPSSVAELPALVMLQPVRVNPLTLVPLMPSSPVLMRFIDDRLTDCVLVNTMPLPVVFWIVPPEPAPPVPDTVRPPLAPVVFRMIPFVGPLAVPAEMLRNFRPLAPIVVFATLRAVPVVVVKVLVVSVAVTVPPPVAVKAGLAPVLAVMAPVKLIVAPVLLVNEMPLPLSLIAPEKLTVSLVRLATAIALPDVLVIGIPRVTLPLPPLMFTAVPEAPAGSEI